MNFKNLPKNWKVVRLGRVMDILTQTINPFENPDEQFLLYSFEAYDNFKTPEIRLGGEIRSNKIILSNDCVLFARLNPRKERVWKVKLNKNYINIASTEFVSFTPKINLDLEYLYWVLKTIILPRAQKNISGTTRSRERVSKEFLANLPIPLPPLPEQKRIVEILSLAEDLIKRQKEAIALIDKILMAKFLDMFGDPATNPKGWEVGNLGEVAEVKGGGTPSRKKSEFFEGNIAWATPTDLSAIPSIFLEDTKEHITEEAIKKSSTTLMPPKTVLLSSRATIGLVAISKIPICFNQGITGFYCDEDVLLPQYLFFVFKKLKDKLPDLSGSTTFPEIKRTTLRNFQIPLPPLPLQQEFAQIVEEFEKKRKEMQNTLETLESLFKVLQKKAFTGELTAEWRKEQKIDWVLPKITERQAILLALLYYSHIVLKKPAMLTFAMKEAFLLQREAGLTLGYEFIPYKYGPFSKEVYEDIEELEKNLLVEKIKPSRDIEKTEVTISEDFKDWTEKLIDKLSEKHKILVQFYVQKYGTLSYNELIDYVYSKYPQFTIKSKRKKK